MFIVFLQRIQRAILGWCNYNGFIKREVRAVANSSDLALFTGQTLLCIMPVQAYRQEIVA